MCRLLTVFETIATIILLSCVISSVFAETRVALVIGNGAYQNIARLPNPSKDAKAVAAALTRSGFDTILATDLDKRGMEEATIRFSRAARTADIAMFYYSGHALQFNGVNYLAPIDVTLTDEADLRRMTKVDDVIADLQQAKNLRILVLDACRDNPLAEQLRRSIGTTRVISVARGLARIDAPQGMIMAYATQAGRTADDGAGDNSPYTTAFLRHIEEQNEIGTIFREISEDVYESTKHAQLPELSLSIIGRFYLRGKAPDNTNAGEETTPPPGTSTTSADFEAAARVDTAAGWDQFLSQHSVGFYAELARERKAKLESKLATVTPSSESLEPRQMPLDLTKKVQSELRRVGCNPGAADGNWNAASEQALQLFNKHAGMRLDVKLVTTDTLDAVRSRTGRVCPLSCSHGYKVEGETCVKIVCASGSHLSGGNRCERDSPGHAARKEPRIAAPAQSVGQDSEIRRAVQAQFAGNYRRCMGPLPGCYGRAIKNMSPEAARAWCSRRASC